MFISISSSYQWYNYQGKSVEFNDHHPEYDLDLKPGELFGISGNKVIHDGETKIIFKLSDVEIKGLIKNSSLLNYDHDLYPRLALPCTAKDVARVFAFYNKKLFNNEVPKTTKFRLMSAKGFEGKARFRTNGDAKLYTLYYGKQAMTDVPAFCNMIVHEMIHLLHYKREFEDGRKEYNESGHGPKFVEDMTRINKLGYKIVIQVTDKELSKLQAPVYIIVLPQAQRNAKTQETYFNASKYVTPFYSDKPFDPEKVVEDLKNRYGVYPGEYKYGTTLDSAALHQIKLTSQGRIPARIKINSVTTQFDVKVIDNKTLKHEVEGVDPKFVYSVNLGKQQTIQLPKLDYIETIIEHAGYQKPRLRDANKNTTMVPDAAFKFIVDSWYQITDEQIVFVFKRIRKHLLQRKLDGEEALHYLYETYERFFKERVEPKRYAELVAKYFDIITMSSKAIVESLLKKMR